MLMELKPRTLPNPATTPDEFAYATVFELRRLNANIESLVATIQSALVPVEELSTEDVELKEPESKPKSSHRDAKKATDKATE